MSLSKLYTAFPLHFHYKIQSLTLNIVYFMRLECVDSAKDGTEKFSPPPNSTGNTQITNY